MDITFHCTHCKQELAVDASAAGSDIECPTCHTQINVPAPDSTTVHTGNPMAASAAAKIERHFSVPVHDTPAEVLITAKVTDTEAEENADGPKKIKVRIFRHTDCVEVGRDRYEEIVGNFLNRVGESNIINISPLTYTHVDIGSQKILTDYAIQILYRG